MKTLSKIGLLLGAALLMTTMTARAQWSWPSWEASVDGSKAAVAELQMATQDLVIMDKNAMKIRNDLLRRLDSAQSKLSYTASPDTIYKAGIDVYKYMKKIYDLGRKGKIHPNDSMMLQTDSIYAFNAIMYVYDNHPYWH